MAKQKLIDKNHKKEGNEIIVTETMERKLDKRDLMNLKQNIARQKERVILQSNKIKEEYDKLIEREKEIDDYISMFPTDTIQTIE